MKKTTLAVLLPLAAGLALAGTGFGAWVFSENVSAASAGDTIKVTPAISLKNLTVVMDDDEITLDQAHDADMHIAYHFEIGNDLTTGLIKEVNATVANQTEVTYQDNADYNLDTAKDYIITYSFKYDIALEGGAAAYLNDPDGTGKEVTNAQMTLSYDTLADNSKAWTLHAPDMTNLKENTFTWKDGNATHIDATGHTSHGDNEKPQTLAEYNAMIEDLKDEDTKIVLNLTGFTTSGVVCKDHAAEKQTVRLLAAKEGATYQINSDAPVTLTKENAVSAEADVGSTVTLSFNGSDNNLLKLYTYTDSVSDRTLVKSETSDLTFTVESGLNYYVFFLNEA